MYGTHALARYWSGAEGSTKIAIVLGALTFASQLYSSMPLDGLDLVGLVMSAASILLAIYVVHCLNRGSCGALAWLVALAPILTFAFAISLPNMTGIRISNS